MNINEATRETKQRWITSSDWRLGMIVGLAIVLLKLPLMSGLLGEDDQGRMIMGAIAYATDGPAMIFPYFIYTSPLWTLALAAIVKLFGMSHLVLLTNIGGLLCGGFVTAFAFILLRRLGASVSWSLSGAIACGLVPGTFYMSLYGYPSQYALPLLLLSAVAFAESLDAQRGSRRWCWFVIAGTAYCGLALIKVDFALTGSFLLSIAIIKARLLDRKTMLLPVFAGLAIGVVYLVILLAIEQPIGEFLRRFNELHPHMVNAGIEDDKAVTVLYAIGFGTLALWMVALIRGLAGGQERGTILRVAIGWVVAVLPLWMFWMGRPPMSTRHSTPLALITVITAALLASRAFKNHRVIAVVWLLALVGINWPVGEPRHDINYYPSGNLAGALSFNRKTFTVAADIAQQVVERQESAKFVIGPRLKEEFGSIDFVPVIEVEMAARSHSVKAKEIKRWKGKLKQIMYEYVDNTGNKTLMYPYIMARRAGSLEFTVKGSVGYYSPWKGNKKHLIFLQRKGIEVMTFDPDKMLEELQK
jgi:hypothetical protein